MAFKQGTVVLIPFPFSDLTGLKQRPALVMSSEESQRETRQVICMMITSTAAALSTDYGLTSWQQSGLLKPSVVKVNRIFTINSDLVKRAMGGTAGQRCRTDKIAVGSNSLFPKWKILRALISEAAPVFCFYRFIRISFAPLGCIDNVAP